MSFRLISTVTRVFRGGFIAAVLGTLCFAPSTCSAQLSGQGELAERKADAEEFFQKSVTPFIKTYCLECHRNFETNQ